MKKQQIQKMPHVQAHVNAVNHLSQTDGWTTDELGDFLMWMHNNDLEWSMTRGAMKGTIRFRDTQAGVDYAMYESGYVRRIYRKGVFGPIMYQLNPRKPYGKNFENDGRDIVTVIYPGDYRKMLSIIKRVIPLYRERPWIHVGEDPML